MNGTKGGKREGEGLSLLLSLLRSLSHSVRVCVCVLVDPLEEPLDQSSSFVSCCLLTIHPPSDIGMHVARPFDFLQT